MATVYDKFEKLANGKWRPVTAKAVAMDAASSRIDAKAADLIAARLLRNAAMDDAADDALATLFPRLVVAMDNAEEEQAVLDGEIEEQQALDTGEEAPDWYKAERKRWAEIHAKNLERRSTGHAPVSAVASKGH